jgi:CHASE3 domain sensor protein
MGNDDYVNPFQKVHQQVQAAKDRIRAAKQSDSERHKENAEKEAVREGFAE